jgi:predicted MFS family arabinose efflux permease
VSVAVWRSAIWGAATDLVSGIGILAGGVLTGELSWRWIFVVNVAVAAVIALLALRATPESRDPTAPRQIDLPGAFLTATGLTAITLACIQGATWGWDSPAIIALLIGGVAVFAIIAVVERRTEHPLVNFDFFRRRNFLGATTTIFVIDFSFGAMLFFLPEYFQDMLGYSATETGALLLPLTGLMVIASPLGGRVAARVGPRPPIVIGLTAMLIAIYWISTLSVDTGYAEGWAPTAIMGFGLALTPMNLAARNAVSRHHAGAASGLLVTLSGLGATVGVAVTGAAFAEIQTTRTVDLVGQAGHTVSRSQAQELDGLLSGTPGAHHTLEKLSGGRRQRRRAGCPRGVRLGAGHRIQAVGGACARRRAARRGAAAALEPGRRRGHRSARAVGHPEAGADRAGRRAGAGRGLGAAAQPA